jgi:hypothetical protein
MGDAFEIGPSKTLCGDGNRLPVFGKEFGEGREETAERRFTGLSCVRWKMRQFARIKFDSERHLAAF